MPARRGRSGRPAGRLHHDRLLGSKDAVAAELAGLLPEMSAEQWLDLFDEVVATLDPRERHIDVIRGAGRPATIAGHTARLLGVVPMCEK